MKTTTSTARDIIEQGSALAVIEMQKVYTGDDDFWAEAQDDARTAIRAALSLFPNTGCPAIGPSDQECIGRATKHEVHADSIGTTWRDWAGKQKGLWTS